MLYFRLVIDFVQGVKLTSISDVTFGGGGGGVGIILARFIQNDFLFLIYKKKDKLK